MQRQLRRAATSVALNIAEGSTSQSDAEQARFLGLAVRSLIETVACQHLIHRRRYFDDPVILREAYRFSHKLFVKIQAFRNWLKANAASGREDELVYEYDDDSPF